MAFVAHSAIKYRRPENDIRATDNSLSPIANRMLTVEEPWKLSRYHRLRKCKTFGYHLLHTMHQPVEILESPIALAVLLEKSGTSLSLFAVDHHAPAG
jgi:hypothetical protein